MTKTERAIEHFEGMVRLAQNRHPHPELEFWQAALDALRLQQEAEKNELNSEMRLIDANALKKQFGERRLDHDFCIPYDEATARDIIDDAPTIDPVKHGHWINVYGDYTTAECSYCKNQLDALFDKEANGALWEGFVEFYKFCPACGAEMDGGRERWLK